MAELLSPLPPPRPVATLRHHTAALSSVGFARGNRLLLSGDCDGMAAVWQLSRRRVVAEWTPHPGAAVLKVQEFGGGSGGGDGGGGVRSTGNNGVGSSEATSGGDAAAALPPTLPVPVPPRILTQGRDGAVRIWDTSRLNLEPRRVPPAARTARDASKLTATVEINAGSYSFCKCATLRWPTAPEPEERQAAAAAAAAAAGGGDGPSVEAPFIGRCGPLRTDEWVVVPSSEPSVAQLWDLRGGTQRHALTLSPDAAGGSGGASRPPTTGMLMSLALIDPAECGDAASARGAAAPLRFGRQPVVLAGYESGHVAVFDLAAGGKLRAMERLHDEPILALDVDRAAAQIVTGAAETTVCVSSLSRGESGGGGAAAAATAEAQTTAAPPSAPRPIARSGLGASLLAAADENGASDEEAPVATTATPTAPTTVTYALAKSHSITLDKAGVEALALRGDHGAASGHGGGIFASAGWDRRIRIYEWASPHRPLALLKQHSSGICSVAWSDDGRLLASAAKDGNISLWSLFPPVATSV